MVDIVCLVERSLCQQFHGDCFCLWSDVFDILLNGLLDALGIWFLYEFWSKGPMPKASPAHLTPLCLKGKWRRFPVEYADWKRWHWYGLDEFRGCCSCSTVNAGCLLCSLRNQSCPSVNRERHRNEFFKGPHPNLIQHGKLTVSNRAADRFQCEL